MPSMKLLTPTKNKDEDLGDRRSYSDLPHEILSAIADRLQLIELLSFRGTCKDFRSASYGLSANIENCRSPWLLFHKPGSSECTIYNYNESETYKRNIPDLEDAICLASYEGWLLLFKNESMYFFCPFSLAKITLPDFPHKQIDGHVAAFSEVPTSRHCIISVINRIDSKTVEVNVISKGEKAWTTHQMPGSSSMSSVITAATFDRKSRTFYYMDNGTSVLTFSVEHKTWTPYRIMKGEPKRDKDTKTLPYTYWNDVFSQVKKDDQFNFKEEDSVTVCGLSYDYGKSSKRSVYLNEVVDGVYPAVDGVLPTKTRMSRAVWIQPRFFEADHNQRW